MIVKHDVAVQNVQMFEAPVDVRRINRASRHAYQRCNAPGDGVDEQPLYFNAGSVFSQVPSLARKMFRAPAG